MAFKMKPASPFAMKMNDKKRGRKERREHNRAARRTEGTSLMQLYRRKFGKNKAK